MNYNWLHTEENNNNFYENIEPQPPNTLRSSKGITKITSPRTYVPSRPVLLRQIEDYLQYNLEQLANDNNNNDNNNNDNNNNLTEDWLANKRLKIYRDAFQMYIDEFNIYKPFLLAVKHEYETMLDYFSVKARNQLKVKTDTAAKQREFVQQLKQKDQIHTEEMDRVRNEITNLQKQLTQKDSQITTMQSQINYLKGTAGKSDSEVLETRQSCITLTNALTRIDDEKKRLAAREVSKQSEIMALKVALQKGNNDLDRLRLQLHDLEAEQSNLVSTEIVEKHLNKIQELQDQMKLRDEQMKNLIQRYSLLKNAIETAFLSLGPKIGRGTDMVNMNKLDWNDKDIAKQIEKVLRANGADPRKIVETLIDKVCILTNQRAEETNKQVNMNNSGMKEDGNDGVVGVDEDEFERFESPWTHFDGLGLGPEVPVYLRTTGKVQNLRYSKKETEIYLNEIWIAKEEYEAEIQREKAKSSSQSDYLEEPTIANGGKIHLRDFYIIFLEQKFKTEARSIEFSYNFFDSLKKYDFDSDCKLFLMIMSGELTEEIRHDQLMLLNTLLEEFQREEFSYRQSEDGRLPVDSFMRVIKRVIPNKGEHALRRLQKALDLEIKGRKYVQYREILEEDEQGNQGKFCETLRIQHVTECLTYSNHVMEIIDQFSLEEEVFDENELPGSPSPIRSISNISSLPSNPERMMTISRLREALVFADPDNQRAGVNKLLARACGIGTEEMLILESKRVLFNVEVLKNNLKQGLIKKSYPSGGNNGSDSRKLQH